MVEVEAGVVRTCKHLPEDMSDLKKGTDYVEFPKNPDGSVSRCCVDCLNDATLRLVNQVMKNEVCIMTAAGCAHLNKDGCPSGEHERIYPGQPEPRAS